MRCSCSGGSSRRAPSRVLTTLLRASNTVAVARNETTSPVRRSQSRCPSSAHIATRNAVRTVTVRPEGRRAHNLADRFRGFEVAMQVISASTQSSLLERPVSSVAISPSSRRTDRKKRSLLSGWLLCQRSTRDGTPAIAALPSLEPSLPKHASRSAEMKASDKQ